jgi:hypothetical protein
MLLHGNASNTGRIPDLDGQSEKIGACEYLADATIAALQIYHTASSR